MNDYLNAIKRMDARNVSKVQRQAVEVTAAEKAMQDITALLEQHYAGDSNMTEVDVVMAANRIVGRYDIERIGEGEA